MLDQDSRDLANVILFLDRSLTTHLFLERVSSSKLTWESNGDIQLLEPGILPVSVETDRATAAFRRLEEASFIKRSGVTDRT